DARSLDVRDRLAGARVVDVEVARALEGLRGDAPLLRFDGDFSQGESRAERQVERVPVAREERRETAARLERVEPQAEERLEALLARVGRLVRDAAALAARLRQRVELAPRLVA